MFQGFQNWMTGQDAPQGGLYTPEDYQRARSNLLLGVGSNLLAAGMPISNEQRAQMIGNLPQAIGGYRDDLRSGVQDRAMQAELTAKQKELAAQQAFQSSLQAGGLPGLNPNQAAILKALPPGRAGDAYAQIALREPQQADPFTLGPGQVRYGANGQPLAFGPAQAQGERRTEITEVDGRKMLVDRDTGEVIRDLGRASVRQNDAPAGFRWQQGQEGQTLEPIPGGPGTQVPAELAARVGMAENFLKQIPAIKQAVQGGEMTGAFDAAKAQAGMGEQGQIYRQMQSGVDALMRLMTGAGMNQAEAEQYASRYLPGLYDTSDTLVSKIDQLEMELRTVGARATQGRGGFNGATPSGTTSGGLNWSIEE